MSGAETMSMPWMRRAGQTWPDAAASFVAMWLVMMVAMMLPALVPMLWRYQRAVGSPDETHLGLLSTLVGLGYFFVWTVFGMAHCSQCCVGLMAILLVIGVMNLRAMVVIAAAITIERLAPAGERVARATGILVVGAGFFLIARAAGLA